jgi:acyl carrier protein
MMDTIEEYRRILADMIAEVSGGGVLAEEVLAAEHSLSALGLTSLERVRLIDAVEERFHVDIDLSGDLAFFEDAGTLAAHLADLAPR